MHRRSRLLRAVYTAGIASIVVLIAGGALGPPAQAAPGENAYLRLAHLSPDTPNVDVYVTPVGKPQASFVAPGVGYGTVSEYRVVDAGDYTVSMRPAGAPPSSPPVVAAVLSAVPGRAFTVAGVGPRSALGLTTLRDDLTMPPAGQTRVRVINAVPGRPPLDVAIAAGPSLARQVAFATTTPYTAAPSGAWTLQVASPGTPPTELPVALGTGGVYSVLLVETGRGLAPRMVTDALSSGAVPTGGIETGAGGTASSAHGAGLAVPVATGLVVLVAAATAATGRSRRPGARHTK